MALVTTVAGVNRSTIVKEDTIRITQLADSFTFTAELTLFDVNGNISIVAGSHKVADEITLVDGATTYFGGYVANQDIEALFDGSRELRLQCQGYGILLTETLVEYEEYSATADDAIIDDLFDTYLAVIDSVTHVAQLDASMSVSFTEMSLAEILEALCQRTQGRFYIDNAKKLHYFADENDDCGFDLSDTPNQVTSFSYYDDTEKRVDASLIVNRVRVIGADGYAVTRNDATSQTAYGIRGAIVTDHSLLTTAELEERGDAVLDKHKDPRVTYIVRATKAGAVAGQEVDYKNVVLGLAALTVQTIREMYIYWEQGLPVYEMVLGEAETMALQRPSYTATQIRSVTTDPPLPLAARGWGHDLVFSATDLNTVAWTSGTITTAGGVSSYSIAAGNTGDIAAITYVYLDTAVSLTVLQTTTSPDNAVGKNKILVAVCENADDEATFRVSKSNDMLLVADHLATNSIKTAHIDALQVTTEKINDIAVTGSKLSIGNDYFDLGDGKFLLGPGCELTPVLWQSLRGPQAIIAGSFQTMRGAFPGTQGIVMEADGINIVENPSAGVNVTDYWAFYSGTRARDTTQYRYDGASFKITSNGAAPYLYKGQAVTNPPQGTKYWLSMWIRGHEDTVGLPAQIALRDYKAPDEYNTTTEQFTLTESWQYIRISHTIVDPDRTHLQIIIWLYDDTAGHYCWFDGIQLEATRITTTMIGSMPWCSWSGTVHNSTTTRDGTDMQVLTAGSVLVAQGSISIWLRLLHEWNPSGGMVFSAGDANAEFDAYVTSLGAVAYRFNGAERCSSPVLSKDQDHCVVFEWDDSEDACWLYVDGVLVDTGSMGGATPTLGRYLGIGESPHIAVQYNLCGVITEFAVFGDLLTATEIAEMWNFHKPMIDHGAMDTPGIYIVDGKFRLSSSSSGSRVEMTADEIACYNGTDKIVEIDEDGISVLVSDAYEDIRSYQFRDDSGNVVSNVFARKSAVWSAIAVEAPEISGIESYALIRATAPTNKIAYVGMLAHHAVKNCNITCIVDGSDVATIDIEVNGQKMAVATARVAGSPTGFVLYGSTGIGWAFQDAHAGGDMIANSHLNVWVDGNKYTLSARSGWV